VTTRREPELGVSISTTFRPLSPAGGASGPPVLRAAVDEDLSALVGSSRTLLRNATNGFVQLHYSSIQLIRCKLMSVVAECGLRAELPVENLLPQFIAKHIT